TGDATGILGGLALAVVEVGRHGDHRFGHWLTEIVFGGLLHLLEDFRRYLRRGHLLAVDLYPGVTVVRLDDLVGDHLNVFLHDVFIEATPDQTLHGEQRVVRIGDRLTLGRLTDQDLAVIGIRNDRRRGTTAF